MNSKNIILPFDDPKALSKAVSIIQSGGVIAFPTDTIYGIGVSAFNQIAIDKLYRVKERSFDKAIPILLGDQGQLIQITHPPGDVVKKIIEEFWPGALTIILPLLPDMPENLSQESTVGIRIPDHDQTRRLICQTGPLAATSANLSGEESAVSAGQVEQSLGAKIDLILDGGKSPGGMASTVLDCTVDQLTVLRKGPISEEQIKLQIPDLY